MDDITRAEATGIEEQEIAAAEITLEAGAGKLNIVDVDKELQRVERELEQYTSSADRTDYALAVASGICAGIVDSIYTGEFSLENAHKWGKEKIDKFVVKVARLQGYKKDDLSGAIHYLAEEKGHKRGKGFHLAADSNMADFGWTKQHHLRDFAHHPTMLGLFFSMLTQFTGKSYGTDTTGTFLIVEVRNEAFIGKTTAEKFVFGTVNWFFHLVSDMAGSGEVNSEGTGIPGPLLSIAKMLAATPLFKKQVNKEGNREFSVFISKLYNGTYFGKRNEDGKLIPLRFDLRTEVGLGHEIFKQFLPVALNEILVRCFYFLRRFALQIKEKQIASFSDMERIDWDAVKPAGNRTIDRMLTVASLTFTAADTTDAAVRAALESGGSWVVFAGRFAARFNYIGAGRAVVAIVKEISGEQKEQQLLREKRILTETKTAFTLQQLEEYKTRLEETIAGFIAEDIEVFITGFDFMHQGLATGDSDLVIKGNVVIQRVLGRKPQFTSQDEFDALMDDSDTPLIF